MTASGKRVDGLKSAGNGHQYLSSGSIVAMAPGTCCCFVRMALFPLWLTLLYGISTYASTANISLCPELMSFVPSCAQTCFESFIINNYPTNICSTTPSLECLCSHNSTSGYTIGEGAVQCIISEDNIGFCTGSNATNAVVNYAFSMCHGQRSALPNTHSTITATLILQTSKPSIVIVAPNPTSQTVSTTGNSRTTITHSTKTFTLFSITSSTTTSLFQQSTSLYQQSASSTSPTASAQAVSVSATTNTLTKPQIAGIVAGGVATIALVVGGLLLCRRIRKRKKREMRHSDLLPFQLDPDNTSEYRVDVKSPKHKYLGPGGTSSGKAAKVPPRIPPRIDTYDINMFSRRSVTPDTIGLAISPDSKESTPRRSSKLLPEKPTLTVKIPEAQGGEPTGDNLNYSQSREPVYGLNRESTTTQFEEDLESAKTVGSPMDFRGRRSYHRPQNSFNDTWKIFPSPDKTQLAQASILSTTAGAASHWRPEQLSNNDGTNPELFVRPLTIRQSTGGIPLSRQPTIPILQSPQQQQPKEMLQRLDIPTQVNRPVTGSSIYSARSSLPPSETGRNSNSNIRNSSRARRKSYKQTGPYESKRESEASLTSFETDDSAVSQPEPRTAELSPVVESPASGRSPVSYPKIPKRLSGNIIRMVPPPPQPDFTKGWRQADSAAARARRYEQQGQGSIQSQNYLAPAPLALPKGSASPFNDNHQPEISEELRQAGREQQRSNSTLSADSASTTSTLLVKRRGSKKAAELTLKSEEEVRKHQKWRVLKDAEIKAAKDPGWRPQLGDDRSFPQEFERTALPSTPGWVPKLTPTRRGDDLFLSVQ
ncbi:hypothetical protein B7463_g10106, partial [Scytalidium lignicola]